MTKVESYSMSISDIVNKDLFFFGIIKNKDYPMDLVGKNGGIKIDMGGDRKMDFKKSLSNNDLKSFHLL